MLSENQRKRVTKRISELIEELDEQQFKTSGDIHNDENRITIGQYSSLLNFSTTSSPDPTKAILRNIKEANGSSFMGLWFMSGAMPFLEEAEREAERLVYTNDPAQKAEAVEAFRNKIVEAMNNINAQLTLAKDLPKFFQGNSEVGTTTDIKKCPQYTMGWYPLVDGTRIPAVIPEFIEQLFDFIYALSKKRPEKGMSNLSDGDIWSWFIATNDVTPGVYEAFGEEILYHPSIYKQLLGTYQADNFPVDDLSSWLSESSIELWDTISPLVESDRFPIITFYNPEQKPGGDYSCAVMSNILAAIPVLDSIPQEDLEDIKATAMFVREAAKQALIGNITWELYAYDYYTIPTAPVGYLMRAHRAIIERKEQNGYENYPDLLDQETLQLIADYTAKQAKDILDKPNSNILAGNDATSTEVQGNMDYATLVYCFSTMMNLWKVDPDLYAKTFKPEGIQSDRTLVALTAELLLTSNEAANRTPGTGPYQLDIVGQKLYVTMSSICFIVPPMLEAYALYLLSEAEPES